MDVPVNYAAIGLAAGLLALFLLRVAWPQLARRIRSWRMNRHVTGYTEAGDPSDALTALAVTGMDAMKASALWQDGIKVVVYLHEGTSVGIGVSGYDDDSFSPAADLARAAEVVASRG